MKIEYKRPCIRIFTLRVENICVTFSGNNDLPVMDDDDDSDWIN